MKEPLDRLLPRCAATDVVPSVNASPVHFLVFQSLLRSRAPVLSAFLGHRSISTKRQHVIRHGACVGAP
jgi:hypothetical protein